MRDVSISGFREIKGSPLYVLDVRVLIGIGQGREGVLVRLLGKKLKRVDCS